MTTNSNFFMRLKIKCKVKLRIIQHQCNTHFAVFYLPKKGERYFNAFIDESGRAAVGDASKGKSWVSSGRSIMHLLWEQNQCLEGHVKNMEVMEGKIKTR